MKRVVILILLAGLTFFMSCKSGENVKNGDVTEKDGKGYAVSCYDSKVKMINELGLTDDQTAKILNIDGRYEELYLIRKNESTSVRLLHRRKIESVLTLQQKEKFLKAYEAKYGKK